MAGDLARKVLGELTCRASRGSMELAGSRRANGVPGSQEWRFATSAAAARLENLFFAADMKIRVWMIAFSARPVI
jgi:hypothetical protein